MPKKLCIFPKFCMSLTIMYSLILLCTRHSCAPSQKTNIIKKKTTPNPLHPFQFILQFKAFNTKAFISLFSVTSTVTCIFFPSLPGCRKGKNSSSYLRWRAERALQEEHMTRVWLMHTASTANFCPF